MVPTLLSMMFSATLMDVFHDSNADFPVRYHLIKYQKAKEQGQRIKFHNHVSTTILQSAQNQRLFTN